MPFINTSWKSIRSRVPLSASRKPRAGTAASRPMTARDAKSAMTTTPMERGSFIQRWLT